MFLFGYVWLLLLLSWTYNSNGLEFSDLNGKVLNRLLTGLEKAYNFYESEYEDVNLDGIYGLRVSEGALLKILKEQKSGKLNLSKPLLRRISLLERKAAKAAGKSLPQLKRSNPSYYKKFKTAVAKPWENFKSFKKLDHSLYVPAVKRSQITFDEDSSDQCMTEMTGTSEQIKKPCQLSGQCWDMMTAKGANGYALTHQALFLLIGEGQGCKKELLDKLKSSKGEINLERVYDRICASMYPQMLKFEKTKKHIYQYQRDLYMEQGMVCGSMGYYEFLSVKRLNKILKWQKKSGCFGGPEYEGFRRDTLPKDAEAKKTLENGLEEKLYDELTDYELEPGVTSRKLLSMRTMRSLLVEKALGGGCMSHITGVATGLLGVYLRWAVHLMYPAHKLKTSPNTKQVSQDVPGQQQHIFLRKVMHNQSLLAKNVLQENKSSKIAGYFLLAVAVLLLVFVIHLIIKNSTKIPLPVLGLFRKAESLRIWDRDAIQKRNI